MRGTAYNFGDYNFTSNFSGSAIVEPDEAEYAQQACPNITRTSASYLNGQLKATRDFSTSLINVHSRTTKIRTITVSGREHPLLGYDSVFLLLNLVIADGALDPEDLSDMIHNGGDDPVEWDETVRDRPICRQVDLQGNVHPTDQ
ncbi:hypothetical protein C2857_003245 [Epichloe festucae Fl1]|uniref:Uncharacterized protein n=1 Tax=Epichloe festucae (strain Fl1) TaxID=877507 RepID=A0A7S9PWV5_EPIFF|nr:hypothetical protein C2857_003245 [Epichloe festucae Fl1]